ncbi:peptidoglycan-binding protein [Kribbella sp. NPDC050124]|uniref:C40 family peptidase n=1 Tax=Kribbella sp. NPDC050124 TaxID=3364114 RepID=UPI0037B033A4
MGTAAGMIKEARKHIGLTENKGNNRNYMTEWYGANATPWCDIAVSYVAAHSGNLEAVFGKHASCREHINAFKRQGAWHQGRAGIAAGDVVFFELDGDPRVDHVGIVQEARAGELVTLEGNTSKPGGGPDGFWEKKRKYSLVVGYGRPAYGGTGVIQPQPGGKLEVDGKLGPKTYAALQTALNKHGASLGVDGKFGPLTKKALQKHLGVTADGAIGPVTVKALQKKVGAGVDGEWGPDTTRHLQQALNAGTF